MSEAEALENILYTYEEACTPGLSHGELAELQDEIETYIPYLSPGTVEELKENGVL